LKKEQENKSVENIILQKEDEWKKQTEIMMLKFKNKIIKLENNNTKTTINNNHNDNKTINNNIIINNYGNESVNYLFIKKTCEKFINKVYKSIPCITKELYFNPAHPENRTIRIRNKKSPFMEVFNGKEWELRYKKKTLEEITDYSKYTIDEMFEYLVDKFGDIFNTKVRHKIFSKYLKDYENKPALRKTILKDNELIILNETKNLKI